MADSRDYEMKILAIDPGTTQSAWVIYEEGAILDKGISDNELLVSRVGMFADNRRAEIMSIEMVASYGMPVGKSVFETCVYIGRFIQAWGLQWELIYRKDVKMHLCGKATARDSNIRQAIMDLYGSERSIAIGTKTTPGPLYGVSKDIWSALGVAITAAEASTAKARKWPKINQLRGKYHGS